MSCNGCRVLRKGCSEGCVLRQCLRVIESPEAQGHATLFVAKFFGRAGLMSFVSAVPEPQRPALFQSLLFEACGRTINPVNGAVGLLWSGNWHLCQAAVETVLRGGTLGPLPQDEEPRLECFYEQRGVPKRARTELAAPPPPSGLKLRLSGDVLDEKRPGTPSEESGTTCTESGCDWAAAACQRRRPEHAPPLLNLFA
ncbi:LOB domain-containing protein 39-like [Wolffia australiana]